MTETAVATDVHQTLDVHGCFATQVTFQSHRIQEVTDLVQISVRQILDLLGVLDTASFANLASSRTTDAINGGQADSACLWGGMLIPAIRAILVL